MSTERRRRPPLDRSHPIRSWTSLLDGTEPGDDHATDAPDAARGGTASRVSDAVSKSVELGYRVIDDYLQQGQRVARRLSDGRPAPEVWATEIQDLGVRMARYASDFMAAWMELLELTARGGGRMPNAAPTPDGPAPSPGVAERSAPPPVDVQAPRVRVAVRSRRPVEVDVDYRPERVTGSVRVHALRALEADKPRLENVSFQPATAADPPRLVLHVPDAQPPGSYEGLLVDERTNRPVGSVRVDLFDRDDVAS